MGDIDGDPVQMARHVKYTDAERELANLAREITMDRDVLYHGTRYPQLILTTGVLLRADVGQKKVCLTRSPEVAAYWASIKRDDDESRGAVFVLDRKSLERAYKIQAVPEPYWLTARTFHNEAEEEIWDDVVDLASHLVGFILSNHVPKSDWPHRQRLYRLYKKKIGDRVLRLLNGMRE